MNQKPAPAPAAPAPAAPAPAAPAPAERNARHDLDLTGVPRLSKAQRRGLLKSGDYPLGGDRYRRATKKDRRAALKRRSRD